MHGTPHYKLIANASTEASSLAPDDTRIHSVDHLGQQTLTKKPTGQTNINLRARIREMVLQTNQ